MSRRASLPGADELFRKTSGAERVRARDEGRVEPRVPKSPNLQVAIEDDAAAEGEERPRRTPKHDEKVTFYCTGADLMALERVRLELRAQHGVAADRGKIVRAALGYVIEDFEARAEDSILLRRLEG